jgi:hypothetical protein
VRERTACGEGIGDMSFRSDIPDYKSIQSTAPNTREFWDALEALVTRGGVTRQKVNRINNLALLPNTENWGYDWLVNDLSYSISVIREKTINSQKFELLMDIISLVADFDINDDVGLDTINEFLDENGIMYELGGDRQSGLYWSIRKGIARATDSIDSTLDLLKTNPIKQAVEELQQAKKQLSDALNERALKDAVRSCASAMEKIIKECGDDDDIKNATDKMREQDIWGLKDIIKDGNALFNNLHRLYPDLRHGSLGTSIMSQNEAQYWVGRITVFINFLLMQKEAIDNA